MGQGEGHVSPESRTLTLFSLRARGASGRNLLFSSLLFSSLLFSNGTGLIAL